MATARVDLLELEILTGLYWRVNLSLGSRVFSRNPLWRNSLTPVAPVKYKEARCEMRIITQ